MNDQPETGPVPGTISPQIWQPLVARYQQPSWWRSSWQLVNTLGPYALLWWLLYQSLAVGWWLTLPLAVLAAGFQVRTFIIHHDCGHGSFFRSRRANDFWGYLTGVLTFTPYQLWRWEHAIHHAHAGNLDERGLGAVRTMTVQEYLAASRWKRFRYRQARHPIVLFGIAPLILFVVLHRIPAAHAGARERRSVHWTNLGLVTFAVAMSAVMGLSAYLLIQVVIVLIAGAVGVWMFYVQHQFDGVYWQRHGAWDYAAAALRGSSFYQLPKVLQWFTGNIGFHHIHHLSARIPNYNLEKCHNATPLFQAVPPLTLRTSLKCLGYRLWDEQRQRLVGFDHLWTLAGGRGERLPGR